MSLRSLTSQPHRNAAIRLIHTGRETGAEPGVGLLLIRIGESRKTSTGTRAGIGEVLCMASPTGETQRRCRVPQVVIFTALGFPSLLFGARFLAALGASISSMPCSNSAVTFFTLMSEGSGM